MKSQTNDPVQTSAIIKAFDPFNAYFDEEAQSLFLENVHHGISLTFYLKFPSSVNINDLNGYELINNEEVLNKAIILKVEISEYVTTHSGDGNDKDIESDDLDGHTDEQFVIKKLICALRKIFSSYQFIPYYHITEPIDYGLCPPSNLKYYIIELDEVHLKWLESIIRFLPMDNNCFLNVKTLEIDRYKYFKERPPRNNSLINIVQTNTKARRIGYLKYIITKFEKSPYFPSTFLSKIVERDAAIINNELFEYKNNLSGNDKGVIQLTKSGTSAEPYIRLLQGLNIITVRNKSVILTKQSKVYSYLNSKSKIDPILASKLKFRFDLFEIESDNLFKLNLLDRMFFLRQILIHDSFYFLAIVDIISIINKQFRAHDIISVFQRFIIDEINRTTTKVKNDQLRELRTIKERIESWKSPKVYLEHIIEPRLNWLLDLGFLTSETKGNATYYQMATPCRLFSEILAGISEEWFIKHIHIKKYIENHFFIITNYIFGLQSFKITNIKAINVESRLYEAFSIFKTEAPKRIAASQAIEYVCYTFFLYENIIIEFNQLKQFLIDKKTDKFILEWYNSENDGALYIKS